jgi:hypothetical protein
MRLRWTYRLAGAVSRRCIHDHAKRTYSGILRSLEVLEQLRDYQDLRVWLGMMGLCCTNELTVRVPLSPDSLILRLQ